MDETLLQAFLSTRYLVNVGPEPLCLRIGRGHARLDQLLQRRSWAILTASNPRAQKRSDDENQARNRQLLAHAQAAELATRPAINRADEPGWPDEHSLLLIDPSTDWLLDQARGFQQLGLVHGRADAKAELWLLVPCPAARGLAQVREMGS